MTPQQTKDYAALKHRGHTPLKAHQIMLDAERGDKFAQWWLRECQRLLDESASTKGGG